MKFVKRVLCMLLVVSLLIGVLPTTMLVSAAEDSDAVLLQNPIFTRIVPEKTGKLKLEWEAIAGAEQYCLSWRVKGSTKNLGEQFVAGNVTSFETPYLGGGQFEVSIQTVASTEEVQWVQVYLVPYTADYALFNSLSISGDQINYRLNGFGSLYVYEVYLVGLDGNTDSVEYADLLNGVFDVASGFIQNIPKGEYYFTVLAYGEENGQTFLIQSELILVRIGEKATVNRLSPANGAINVEYQMSKTQDLYVYFDRPLELVTTSKPRINFEAGGIRVYRAVDDYCILDAKENAYLADTSDDINCVTSDPKILSIQIAGTNQLLEPDTEYYVEIDEGVLSFEDGSVNPAIKRENWSFTTKSFDTSLLYGDYNEYLGSERARMYLAAPRLELMDALDSYTGTETSAAAVWALSKSLDIGFWLESGWNKLTKGEDIGDTLISDAEEAFFKKFVLGASQVYTNTGTIEIINNLVKSVNFSKGVVEENYWNVFFEANQELLTEETGLSQKQLKNLLQVFIQKTNDEDFEERMNRIINGFEDFGDFMTEAERAVVLAELFTTVIALSQVELEMLNNLIAGLGKSRYIDSEIYKELCALKEKISGGDYEQIVGKYLSEIVLDEVLGLVAEVVKTVYSPNKWLKLGLSIFAEIYDSKLNSVGDIMQANIAMSYAGMLYYTIIDMQDWYDEHGIRMSDKDIAQYEAMVKLYHYSLKLGVDTVGTVVDRYSSYKVEEADHLLGDAQSWWREYQDICLQDLYTEIFHNAQTGLQYEVKDGKVTILGAELNEKVRNKVSKYRTLVIPSQFDGAPVVGIADNAFAGVSGLEHVILPEGIETIGECSFIGCTDLCYLSVPEGVKTIGSQAVSNCENLKTISLPESVENVSDSAFSQCSMLESVFVFGYDTTLGADMVSGTNATLIAMPGSETEIYAKERGIGFEELHLAAVSATVIKGPEKTIYEIGEDFDDTGMIVEVKYADGSKQEFTSGWSVLFDASKAGETVVEIFIEGCVTELIVTVRKNNADITERPHTKLPGIATKEEKVPSFWDVGRTDWFYDYVQYVNTKGLMHGVTDDLFAPDMYITRGMIVTILHRLEGEPTANAAVFTDVRADDYYAEAVAWAAENGIVTGYGNGIFAPNAPITREQLATILHRYAEHISCDTADRDDLSEFADVGAVSSYALDSVQWAVGVGLMNGVGADVLQPGGTATRAQAATILMRLCEDIIN